MSFRHLLSLFLIIVSLKSFSFNEEDNQAYYLASMTAEPSSLIDDSVSVITGDYIIKKEVIVANGVEPIKLPLTYISTNNGHTLGGWHFFDYLAADIFLPPGIHRKHRKVDICATCYIPEKNGIYFIYNNDPYQHRILYEKPESDKKNEKKRLKKNQGILEKNKHFLELKLSEDSYKAGLTNCSSDQISGRLNIKNNKIYFDTISGKIIVYAADGSIREYQGKRFEEYDQFSQPYFLSKEHLPNNNNIHYEYQNNGALKRIWTSNHDDTKIYAEIIVHYKDNGFYLHSSDGSKYEVKFKKEKGKNIYYIEEIDSSIFPFSSYNYMKTDIGPLLIDKINPNNRNSHVNYYAKGTHNVQNNIINIDQLSNENALKVISLSAPVGPNNSFYKNYEFIYHPGKFKETSGSTEVYDAENNKTIYEYTPYLRLKSITKFKKDHSLLSKETLVWGKENSDEVTYLLGKSYLNEKNQPIFSKRFFYDKKGNVINERMYGNISGNCKYDIQFDNEGLPNENGVEYSEINRKYSDDERNLLIEETEQNGKKTQYEYLDNSDLILSKYEIFEEQIKIRHFYEYNDDYILIKEITDNGSSKNKTDLSNVTQRTIKNISPKKDNPFIGMPKIIEEKYLDINTLQEKTLYSVHLEYSSRGQVIQKDFYDSNDKKMFSLSFQYDNNNNLTKQTDPLHRHATYEYDSNFNKIKETEFSNRIKKEYFYDHYNRLIKIDEKSTNNVIHTSEYKYDLKSNKISETDYLGNKTFYEYDYFNQPTKITLPKVDNNTPQTINTYDSAGRKILTIDANNNKTETEYNILNQPTKIYHPDGTLEQYIYNLDGTIKTYINQANEITNYFYDYQKRKTKIQILSNSNEIASEEFFSYDSFNLIEHISPDKVKTSYVYNNSGKRHKEIVDNKFITEYQYDCMGRLISTIYHNDENTFIIHTDKDLLDRPINELKKDLSGNILNKMEYHYDSLGNKDITTHYYNNKPSIYQETYDDFNRLIKSSYPDGYNYSFGRCCISLYAAISFIKEMFLHLMKV